MKQAKTYAEISAMQFAILYRLVQGVTMDAEAKQLLLSRVETVMEFHQDILTELETMTQFHQEILTELETKDDK